MNRKNEYVESVNRELRLLALIDESAKLDSNIEQQNFEESLGIVAQIIEEAEDVNKHTTLDELKFNPNQVVLDTTLLKMNFKHISKLLTFINNFNDSQMVQPIKEVVFKDGNEDWDELAKMVCCFSKTVSLNATMLGYVDAVPKQQIQRERLKRNKNNAVEQRPVTVTNIIGEEKGVKAVEETLEQISELCKQNGVKAIPYYHLIVDPNDFSNTVQNSFNLSFLIRENAVLIQDGSDGYPEVVLLSAKERKTLLDKKGETSQAICTLTMDICKQMIQHYNIEEPLLQMQRTQQNADGDQ